MLFRILTAIYLSTNLVWAQVPEWEQCGGMDWAGATDCVSGTVCTVLNPFYSQCLKGTATTTPPATTTTPVTTPTAPSSTTTVGTPAASCAALPASITLKNNTKLPDPFTFFNGAKVGSKADWACRSAEISQLFQRYELGVMPPKPSSVTASLSGTTLTITTAEAGKSISFTVTITAPSGTGPFPAMIVYGGFASIPIPAGVATIAYNNVDLGTDSTTHGQGKFYTLYGTSSTAGAMTAWAWGVSRIIDALQITPAARINPARIGVTGCSRYGKGALVAGAFDTRVVLTIPQESGSGGSGCWRIAQSTEDAGIDTETALNVGGGTNWLSPTFNQFMTQVNILPFDHHMLSAMVAPRGMLVIENTGISYLGPRSVWGCQTTANKIWQALGSADSMGVSQVGNHNHCALPASQNGDVAAFINKFLLGQSTNTSIMKTDGANQNGFVASQWVDWTTPTLS